MLKPSQFTYKDKEIIAELKKGDPDPKGKKEPWVLTILSIGQVKGHHRVNFDSAPSIEDCERIITSAKELLATVKTLFK